VNKAIASLNDRIDEIFAEWDTTQSPGMALAVKKAGEIIYKRGYGMADLDHNIAIAPDTVFHCASLAKQFTAMCILLLAGDGKLHLCDDVHRHIQELPACIPPITIRQLLNHTSGLRCMLPQLTLAGWRWGDDAITRDHLIGLVRGMESLNFDPGTLWSYSNTNYFLAGEIVARRSDEKSLSEFARKRIFEPLCMTSTRFVESYGETVKNRAYGYRERNSPGDGFEKRMPNYDLTGPTNLVTTVEDLMRWDGNFDSKIVGGEAAVAELQKPDKNDYALGLWVFLYENRTPQTVWHNGTTIGHRSFWKRYNEYQLTVALLCNREFPREQEAEAYGVLDDLGQLVAIQVLEGKIPAPAPVHPRVAPKQITRGRDEPPQDLGDYVGSYYSSEIDTTFDIKPNGASLELVRHPRHKYPPVSLTPVSGDLFQVEDLTAVLPHVCVRFLRKGTVTGFRLDGRRLMNFCFAKQS
jgi:CubicO group peptidase (beta-lactamase class C family)